MSKHPLREFFDLSQQFKQKTQHEESSAPFLSLYSVGVSIPLKLNFLLINNIKARSRLIYLSTVSNETVSPFSHIFLYKCQHSCSFGLSNLGLPSVKAKSISSALASGAESGFEIEMGGLEFVTYWCLSGSFLMTLSTELTLCESLETSFEVLLSGSLKDARV